MLKKFTAIILIVIALVGIVPSSVCAEGINPNIKPYYSGIMQELNELDRYPSWETWRNGCLHRIKQYLDQWMLYAYSNEEYIQYTMKMIKRFFASTCAVTYIGTYHLSMIRDFACFLSGELSDSEFEQFLSDTFGKNPEYFYRQNAELIAHSIVNASTGLQIDEIENLDSANFDMVISAFLNGEFGVVYNVKEWAKGSLANIGVSTALNTAIRTAMLADGYNIIAGSDVDRYIDSVSNTLLSGSPAAWIKLSVDTASMAPNRLNEVFQSVDENFTAEMQKVEQHRIAAAYRTTVISHNNIYTEFSNAKTQEQVLEVAVDEILKSGEILQRLKNAVTVEEIDAIEKELYIETEPAEITLTDEINISFEEDVSERGIEESITVFKDGEECTEKFNIVKNGSHSAKVTPKDTVGAEECYKIVYYKNRKPVIHTVTYKETAVKSNNAALISVDLSIADEITQTAYFTDTDTVKVVNFEKITAVKTADEKASYKISYDKLGNGFIEVTAENGLNTAIYSVRNVKEVTPEYSVSVMKDGGTSVKIICDFTNKTVADNLYIGVYDSNGKLISIEKYDNGDGYAPYVPYTEDGKIGLLGINLKTMQSLAGKYEIVNVAE